MTNKKSTKRSLLFSALSLFLCIGMLAGTTFAWFTDSVSSNNNVIVSGNLDVELYWSIDGEKWDKVDEQDEIFKDETLWEPGHTEVVYLKVVNEGSLALKYQLGVNIVDEKTGTNMAGDSFKLSDYIEFGVKETAEAISFEKREDALTAIEEYQIISAGYTNSSKLGAKNNAQNLASEEYATLVVTMPETVGNVANHNGKDIPFIQLGITLFATQLAAEEDSFDANYDKDAWHPEMKVYSAEDLQAAINNGETNIVLMDNIELTKAINVSEGATVALNLNGKTITGTKGRDADNNRIHVIVNNGILTIKDGTVKSAGNDGGSAIYNNAGATLTIEDVTLYGAPQSDPVYEAGVSKPFPSYAVNNYGNAVVNGATVKSYHGAIATGGNGVTVINDADIDVGLGQSTGITSYLIYSYENAQVTVNDGKFAFTKQEIYVNGGNTFCELGTNPIIINGGNYTGTSFSTGAGREYVIKGGTFDKDPSKYVAAGFKAVQNTDGTYSVIFPQDSFNQLIANAGENETIEVPAGEYTFPASNLKAGQTLNCAPGTVFEGKSAMNINGATVIGATFSNPDGVAGAGTINGTFKDCVFEGSEALRWCYAGETVVFENCEFKTDFRGVHFDGMDHDVIFKNCKLNGFNAFGGTATVTFEGCTFGHDESRYNGLNMYCNTVLKDCKFEFVSGKTSFIDFEEAGHNLTITNCTATLDGEAANVLDFVGGTYENQTNITIDGKTVTSNAADVVNGGNFLLTGDIQNNSAIKNDTSIDLGGNTFEATGTVNLTGNADLTMTNGDYVVNGTFGHIDVRPDSAEGSTLLFENVDFSYNKLEKTYGPSTNRLGTVVEICAAAADAKSVVVFRNCTFNNAQVLIEGLSGKIGIVDVTFENCTFTALTSSAPIKVDNYVNGKVTVTGCTFNLECTSSVASAISVNPSSSTVIELIASNNTINATAATASGENGTVEQVKVNGTPANIKFISAYDNATVTETNTVKSGIAKQ